MSVSTGSIPSYPLSGYEGAGIVFHHLVRIEVVTAGRLEKLNVGGVLLDLVKKVVAAAKDDTILFTDTKGEEFSLKAPPNKDKFAESFMITQVDGKDRKVLLGFQMWSKTPFSKIKSNIGMKWFLDWIASSTCVSTQLPWNMAWKRFLSAMFSRNIHTRLAMKLSRNC